MPGRHDWLDLLADRTERFAQVVEHGDLAAPITSCPGWTLRKLVDHLGGVHQWAAHAVAAGDPTLQPEPAPPEGGAELAAWYRRHASDLVDVLTQRSPDAPAWTMDPGDQSVGFWRRRQVHEVTLHLWDAEQALGTPRPIRSELAWDGVAEVVDIMYPRQVRLGRTTPLVPAIRLTAADLDDSLVIGNGEPVEVIAPADVLLRALWHRAGDDEIGSHAISLLSGALTP